ncbi:hypothetical protein B0T26DRAFT_670896 [Lasiosphaeria miniovina]|uniref:Uncharacterized protein n=1 Tax=Lasiosphaeria miniovina TaxID=1954250 RepID=A0AA40BI24_9PEZI|nr:uncharacterized protein B0T26DRAFT_670896 [Lasiosphaeria miniovina]KAK0734626.1 hypothetical protein B0T26DRAFT_670896 [Lasiosphaeria miniovina]
MPVQPSPALPAAAHGHVWDDDPARPVRCTYWVHFCTVADESVYISTEYVESSVSADPATGQPRWGCAGCGAVSRESSVLANEQRQYVQTVEGEVLMEERLRSAFKRCCQCGAWRTNPLAVAAGPVPAPAACAHCACRACPTCVRLNQFSEPTFFMLLDRACPVPGGVWDAHYRAVQAKALREAVESVAGLEMPLLDQQVIDPALLNTGSTD